MTKKEITLLIVVAIIALIGGQLSHYYLKANNTNTAYTLPSFSFPDSAGKMQYSQQWQGKLLVINFWATWCPSCREEIPEFIKLQNEYTTKNVQFVGISVDDNSAIVTNYLKTLAINYPILIGGDNALILARQLGDDAQAIPYSLIVNTQGQIVHSQRGELTRETFQQVITPVRDF